jgi:peroxiredoxin
MDRARSLAPDIALLDAAGRPVSPRAWRGRPVVLIFLRWLG